MENFWFSSDLHFNHKNIQKFCPDTRPQGCSVEEMNERMIEVHNGRVRPEDTWFHMGDFSFGTFEQTRDALKRMNGKKQFYRGNHDRQLDKVLQANPNLVERYDLYRKIRIGDHKIVMMHYPIESWDEKHHGALHIHGHLHGDGHHECRKVKNRIDVGIDTRTDRTMAPFHFDEVLANIQLQNAIIERREAMGNKH